MRHLCCSWHCFNVLFVVCVFRMCCSSIAMKLNHHHTTTIMPLKSRISHCCKKAHYTHTHTQPTNHLDKGARDWLGDYLSRYDGTLLVVSHDENLLQAAVSSIAEVRSGNVELYKSRSHDQVFDNSSQVAHYSNKLYLVNI